MNSWLGPGALISTGAEGEAELQSESQALPSDHSVGVGVGTSQKTRPSRESSRAAIVILAACDPASAAYRGRATTAWGRGHSESFALPKLL